MLHVDIVGLDAGHHQMLLEPDAEDLDLDPETFAHVNVDTHLFVQQNRILTVFTAAAEASLTCDRTLRSFEQPIEGEYSVLFAAPGTVGESEEHDDVRDLLPTDQHLDLTDAVRDTLLLAVPQRKIAPGAEEEEIQTVFGSSPDDEELADPRWAALRALKDEDAP